MGTTNPITFGSRVVWLREAVGMKQGELADLSGIKAGHLSLIESEQRKNPQIWTCSALARVFGVSSDLLITGGKMPHPSDIQRAVDEAREVLRNRNDKAKKIRKGAQHAA